MKTFACAALSIGLFQPFAVANESGCVSFVEDGKDYFPHKAVVEDSQHWTVQYENTYKVVNNTAGSEVYLLYQCGTPIPSDADQYDGVFPVPLEGVGVLSTTVIPFLEILGAREDISAFLGSASWVASPCMGELFDQGLVEAVPNPYNASTIDNISLDLPSFVGNFGGTVLNDEIRDSLSEEDTNLAAFEWLKFYSLFFNMEEHANEIFSATKNRYDCAVENAALLACDNEKKPVVLWASYSYFCGGWDVASCPNYYCEFAENCQAEILSSEDQGSLYSESCFRNYMTTDEFIEFGKDADIWIYTSPDFDTAFADFGANLTDFVSIQDSLVYDTEGTGAGAWFEQRLVEPGKTYDTTTNRFAVYSIDSFSFTLWIFEFPYRCHSARLL